MFTLNQTLLQQINQHGEATFPYEGCGLILGNMQDGVNLAAAIFPVPNSWPVAAEQHSRFRINPSDLLNAELHAMAHGWDIIGIFHSHPNHPPDASPRDLAWAAWTGYTYLITEIRDGHAKESRAWQLLPDRSGFINEQINVLADSTLKE